MKILNGACKQFYQLSLERGNGEKTVVTNLFNETLLQNSNQNPKLKKYQTKNCSSVNQSFKGGFFFRECDVFFKPPKKLFQRTILNLKFKFPTNYNMLLLAGNLNFIFRIVFLEYFYFGDLKNESNFLKKCHLQWANC